MELYFFISPYNSLRFAKVEDFSIRPKILPNTLSYQEEGINTKDFYQLYQLNDALRVQFKSNCSSHFLEIKECDGFSKQLVPIKKGSTDDFNIYEFDIDFSQLTKGIFQIEINATLEGETVVYKSERIKLKESHDNTYHVVWENEKNTQIDYRFGIQHMRRLRFETRLKYTPSTDHDIHKTDNNSYLLDSDVFEHYELELTPIPTAMATTLTMGLSLSNVFIDTLPYIIEATPTVEKLGNSNLYDYKAKFILTNDIFIDKSGNYKYLLDGEPKLLVEDGYVTDNSGTIAI